MKKRQAAAFFVMLLLSAAALCTASAGIMPSVYEAYISSQAGTPPFDVGIAVTCDPTVRNIRIVGDNGYELYGSMRSYMTADGKKRFEMDASVSSPYRGELYVYIKTGGAEWELTDVSFNVNYSGAGAAVYPALTPAPSPVPQAGWDTSVFRRIYLSTVDYSENRIQSRTGPGTGYSGGGAYKTNKISSISALYMEKISGSAWVYTELEYTSGYFRRLYFKPGNFVSTRGVPYMEFQGCPGVLAKYAVPVFGPAPVYDDYTAAAIGPGTPLSILHEENGYLFVEFTCEEGLVRAWVPKGSVTVR